MSLKNQLSIVRLEDQAARTQALSILRSIYREEKGWINEEGTQIPESDLVCHDISWFMVRVNESPVGVLRVVYDPPLHRYREYGFKILDRGLDVEAFLRRNRIAEIGRFAVLPEYRKYIIVAAALMRAAATETVARGYTHYITDVFENDQHSPLGFHTRVVGFQPVATHDEGELNCRSRRITLILDLEAAYRRLSTARNWVSRYLTQGWDKFFTKRVPA